jgi:V8-like Glu-specific endopeptidase
MGSLIAPETLFELRNGVCAVGYLTVPLAEYMKDPANPYFKVVGTGFLIRPTTVLTNRHVLEGLLEAQADNGFPDTQRVLLFVCPGEEAEWQVAFSGVYGFGYPTNTKLDVALIDLAPDAAPQLEAVKPLPIREEEPITIGDPVVVSGYPYGHAMLHKNGKVYRWGPVIQRGYVSAISPYDTAKSPDELLLDVRIAGGMSGAPVFRPTDGTVIGILHSGWEATTALALPLSRAVIEQWLKVHEQS